MPVERERLDAISDTENLDFIINATVVVLCGLLIVLILGTMYSFIMNCIFRKKTYISFIVWFSLVVSILGIFLGLFFTILPPKIDTLANVVIRKDYDDEYVRANFERIQERHKQLEFVVDVHADPLMWTYRNMEDSEHGIVDIKRMIKGNQALQVFGIVSKTPMFMNFESNKNNTDSFMLLAMGQRWPLSTIFSIFNRAVHLINVLHSYESDHFFIIKTQRDLEEYVELRRSLQINNPEQTPQITSGLLGIEGAHCLEGKMENLEILYNKGLRMLSAAHFFDSELGGSIAGEEKYGLTTFGFEVIRKCEELGIIIDISHCSCDVIDDILSIATKPVVASHTGVQGMCDNNRNLCDDHVKKIAETGGVLSIAMFRPAICEQTIQHFVDTVRYVADLVGVEHIALGSDWDGFVKTIIGVEELGLITDALMNNGFSLDETKMIMGENFLRVLRETLPQ
eukprot:TRINITY_DN773_c0_g1_i1.p1 TRINITY_DN773_c0_g1~~TRINITY_DN773_c0_g1_i1.p1  ORF type:complete len:455 (+),score=127.49 TRINITY_DN773_c0_g1_i1:83-1447(+)